MEQMFSKTVLCELLQFSPVALQTMYGASSELRKRNYFNINKSKNIV